VKSVLQRLALLDDTMPRIREFANGALAMRALADDAVPGAIGCTQITEIRYTSGVALADALPPGFELTTQYAAAAMSACNEPEIAGTFVRWLTGPRSADLRTAGGFDP